MLKNFNENQNDSFANYKAKLAEFNKKLKYQDELVFISKLINPKKDELILDFGCGIGTAMKFIKSNIDLKIIGYDIIDYYQIDDLKIYTDFEELLLKERGINKVYFLHSFAHIPNVNTILKKLRESLAKNGEIIVITPNLEFDNFYKKLEAKTDYKKDETVFQHYNQLSLHKIFEECGFVPFTIGQFGDCPNETLINERVFGVFVKVE